MRLRVLFLISSIFIATAVNADVEKNSTQSPFFIVTTELDGEIDALPLKATTAHVTIAGVIAEVVVTQRYENTGEIPLEATYVFPGSTRAAVHAMQMKVGDRVRKAKIQKKAEAKRTYEQAKREGKSASLLEQKRPNVFEMNIANIMPGDVIEVELRYTELLVPEEGLYQFTYPTVVGPRYHSPSSGAQEVVQSENWVSNPYTSEGHLPSYSFALDVEMQAGMPIAKIASTSHTIDVNYTSQSSARVRLDETDKFGGNRDFILSYKLQGDAIESGLLLYEGKDENFFLLMAQPPNRVTPESLPGREYVFIVDVSGSMHGFPLDVSKSLLKNLVGSLKPSDRFNVILFAGASAALAEQSVLASAEHISEAISLIDRQTGGGGTELLPALRRALAMPSQEGMSRSFVVVTDGYISAETQAFDLIRRNVGDANVFAFGIGSSVNRYLIEGLARVGGGEPFVVTKANEANYSAERFREYIASPVLTDIEVAFNGVDAYDVEPLSPPDLLAKRPLLLFGKWKGQKSGSISVRGVNGEGQYHAQFKLEDTQAQPSLAALRYLWARHRIQMLSDYNQARSTDLLVDEITSLGLQYSLLTKYTSFVAVDEIVRNKEGDSVGITQPLPLPEGVSNQAIAATMSVPSVPEPETYAMLLVLLLILAVKYRQSRITQAVATRQ